MHHAILGIARLHNLTLVGSPTDVRDGGVLDTQEIITGQPKDAPQPGHIGTLLVRAVAGPGA
ncbi:hypothetical protein ACFCV8_01900 [Streptomyces sp. NPDC056347]|uniref:hypothetical protein n=1 Tax=Streptomyces sp. NPDC056347 TaxID=3345790 RepID=UPI0035E24FC6